MVRDGDGYRIILGNCFDELRRFKECSIDLVVTDPPYGIDLRVQRGSSKFYGDKVVNDDNLEWLEEFVCEIYRVSKDIVVVFCGWQNIDKFKIEFEKKFILNNILVWDKCWMGIGYNYRPNYELILLMSKSGGIKIKSADKDNILRYRKVSAQRTVHSCQKPVDLMEDLIGELSNEGDIVLDPFMGSGTTGVACIRLGRKFLGIEIDRDIFEKAHIRLCEDIWY